MPSVHFLNVSPGDCSIIQHLSGRVTMIDICDGNMADTSDLSKALLEASERPRGNFRMCKSRTNPDRQASAERIGHICDLVRII